MRRRALIVLGIVAILGGGAWLWVQRPGPDLSSQEAIDRTNALFAQGRPERAVGVWTDFIRRHPDNPEAWQLRGHLRGIMMGEEYAPGCMRWSHTLLWMRFGCYHRAAMRDLDHALELDPTLTEALVVRAEVEHVRAGPEAASDDAQRAIELLDARIAQTPDDADLYDMRAQAYAFVADYGNAETDVERVAELRGPEGADRVEVLRNLIVQAKARVEAQAEWREYAERERHRRRRVPNPMDF